MAILYCNYVLILYTYESTPSRLEAPLRLYGNSVLHFCIDSVHIREHALQIGGPYLSYSNSVLTFCIQRRIGPPRLEAPLFCIIVLYWLLYTKKLALQIGGLPLLYCVSVLVLYTYDSTPSRLEAPLFMSSGASHAARPPQTQKTEKKTKVYKQKCGSKAKKTKKTQGL